MEKKIKREMIGLEGKVLLDTLRRLLRKRARENCSKLVRKTHPADLAWVFRSLTTNERQEVFSIIAKTDFTADFLSELDEAIMLELVENMPADFMTQVVADMAPDDAADILDALPEDTALAIQKRLETDDREELQELLKYGPETAGGIMSPDFMYLDEELTVEEAIRKVQKRSEEKEMVFYLYITHGEGQLTGVLSLRELILHPMHRKLKNIMNTQVISVTTDTDQEEVAHLVSQYNLLALPVVDTTFHLVGIITVDDVIDVIREEATEDFLQMAGAGKDREILLKSTTQNAMIRAPWLFASWLGGVAAMLIIGYFEEELAKVLALASFIPIVMGMGGNIATQSSTIVVRGLATNRIMNGDYLRTVFKEFRVGLILGTLYGILLGLLAFFGYTDPAFLGLSVGLSVFLVMVMAATIGTVIPLVLKRFNIDAAVATGPFVTTAIDLVGVALFFYVAKLLLGI